MNEFDPIENARRLLAAVDPRWVGPANDRQKAKLAVLCKRQDGEVDEKWLNALTYGQAQAEIETREGS